MGLADRVFWLVLRKLWSEWKQSLIVVTPQTVIRWLCLAKIDERTGIKRLAPNVPLPDSV